MKTKLLYFIFIGIAFTSLQAECSKKTTGPESSIGEATDTISSVITTADQSSLLKQQPPISFNASANSYATIIVDSTQSYQTIDGFGYALTGGSAYVINKMSSDKKTALLHELFGNDDNAIKVSYLRISIGASDLDAETFSYDDMPAGETDTSLSHFDIKKDKTDLIPVLKQIIAINPSIQIMGSPWSSPTWMKNNDSTKGGSLLPQYYNVYANYFVKYIQAMKAEGITINSITPQNEPLHPGNNPSMLFPATDEATFIKNNVGPAFKQAGIQTKIIVYDHNCDKPDYPIAILNDADARQYVDGSAFHLYAGDVTALSTVHNAYADKNIYFTEEWTGSNASFNGDFLWHIENVIIGTMKNWSRLALEWNLANDAHYQPHTDGGCTECKGALTIDGNNIQRNVSYYIIAQAAKFVPPGSVRISSSNINGLPNVAFKTPAGKKVLIVLNNGSTSLNFNIAYKNKTAVTTLPASSAATYTW